MIHRSAIRWQTDRWQEELANVVRSVEELCQLLDLDPQTLPLVSGESSGFPLRVPRQFVDRMEKGNPEDPLLLQVLPLGKELDVVPGFTHDPLQESASNPAPGLIHKYHGRALLIVSGACGIHCRYCFRRHFPYEDNNPGKAAWQQALLYLRNDPSITEIILSGGDPLTATDRHLAWLVEQLADIPTLQRLRIHSRMPVVIPQRLTDTCLEWLTGTRLKPVMVIHCNHANELNTDTHAALKTLTECHIPLLNQTVLLRGVNDSVAALKDLSEKLFDYGVMPYYLHLLDPVAGASHFAVSAHQASLIHSGLLAQLPGYLVPKLVREVPDEASKTLVFAEKQ